ncbi:MAG: DUF4347 domain-containing protein [Sulfuritalea sp.]|nr:DUF4347 domain-containing protein [Sulfuritalea sp.]
MGSSVIFIDERVADIESLMAGLPDGSEVIRVGTNADGLDQIVASLLGRSGIDAIHIISHGGSGSILLGASAIDIDVLATHAGQLEAIGKSLTESGDILLYGCNLAAGDAGVQFIGRIAQMTAADITASIDPSGSTGLGGDWMLEVTTGPIEAQRVSSPIYSGLLGVNTAPTFVLGDGTLMTAVGTGDDVGYSIALLADGKMAVTGYAIMAEISNFAVFRYNADGSLDSSFDGDGRLVTAIGSSHNYGQSVAIQPDGKMLVAGRVASSIYSDFALLRYNNDGSFDSSFDFDGKVITDFGQIWDSGQVVALQSDGRILVAGTSSGFALARYNSDGSLDSGFDGDGKVVALLGGYGEAFSMAVQADGGIVVGGYSATGANDDFTLVRFNADGTLDTSFDGDGKVTTDFGTVVVQAHGAGNDQIRAMAVDAAGNILTAGSNLNGTTGNYDFAIARYNPDGSLDTSFSLDGMLTTDFGPGSNDVATGIVIQTDGKILVAGYCGNLYTPDFAVARYNADGSLDSGFGTNGRVITSLSANGDFARSLALQPDGKIVVVGSAYNGSNSDFALVRYNPDGSLDVTFDSARQDTLNNSPIFTLRGNPVLLDSSVGIYDAELFAGGNYAGASVTISRHGGASADDVFSAAGNLGMLTEGGSLMLSGVVIGEVVQNSAGTLRVAFNSNATPSRIDSTLSSMGYAYGGSSPPAIVQLDWVFSDNNDGSQGSGGALAAAGATSVQIYVPPAPTISISAASADLSEGDSGTSTFAFAVSRSGDTTVASSVSWDVAGLGLFAADAADFGGAMPGGTVSFAVGETSKTIGVSVTGDVLTEYDEDFVVTLSGPTGATLGTRSAVGTIRSDDAMIAGTSASDALTGTAGNDVLIGREGNDTLDGGSGDDVLLGEFGPTNLNPPSGGVITVIGYGIDDVLYGGGGNDILDGGIGDDVMEGGAGDDTYVVASAGDVVTEATSNGIDTVFSIVSYTLSGNVENLTLMGGTANIGGTGNELDNILTGNSGRNILDGGAGNDTLLGGNDNDHVKGGAGADNLQGGEGDDMFFLASVAEFASGEVIDGGGGINELRYTGDTDATLVLTANVSRIGTIRIVSAGGDWSGTAAINVDAAAAVGNYGYLDIVGNAGDNVLIGNAQASSLYGLHGNDTLVGGAGDDSMNGNDGSDVFLIASGTDHGPNEWIDGEGGVGTPNGNVNEIRFTSATPGDMLVLSSHISNIFRIAIGSAAGDSGGTTDLNLDASALSQGISLEGNAGANRITGSVGADIISGDSGNDTLDGGLGNDTIDGGAGLDAAQYSGNRGDYTIAQSDWYHYTITDNNPADSDDGVDAVFSVEQLQFAGSMESLQTSASWHGFKHRPITPFWAGTEWQVQDSQRDFDGDGKNDLLLHKPDGSVALWLMDGAERIAGAIFEPSTGRTLIDAMTDYNGDGKTDLGWREADDSNSYWLMGSGWGASVAVSSVTPPDTPPTEPPPPPPDVPPPPVIPPPPPPDGWWQ